MATFSERQGIVEVDTKVQWEGMDGPLRTALWNVVLSRLFGKLAVNHEGRVTQDYHIFINLQRNFFKLPMDEFEKHLASRREWYKDHFETMEWWRVYDFFEFVAQKMVPFDAAEWTRDTNAALESERSAYRMVGHRIVPLVENAVVEGAKDTFDTLESHEFGTPAGHLKTALAALAESRREGGSADAAQIAREARAAVFSLCALVRVPGGHTPAGPSDLDALLRDETFPLTKAHASALRSLLMEPDTEGEHGTALEDAAFLLTFAAASVELLTRKAVSAERIKDVPRKEHRPTPPDPWGERRL